MFDLAWQNWWIWAIISVIAVIIFVLSLIWVAKRDNSSISTLPGPCGRGSPCSAGTNCVNTSSGHQCIPTSQICQYNTDCGSNQRCWDHRCVNYVDEPVKNNGFLNQAIWFRWMNQNYHPVPAGKYHNGVEQMAYWSKTSGLRFSYGKFVQGNKLYLTTNSGHIPINISSDGQLTTKQDRQTDLSIEQGQNGEFYIIDGDGSYLEAIIHNGIPIGMIFRGNNYVNPFANVTPGTSPINYQRAIFNHSH